ncbi:MAG: threonine--tRNA ligase [Acidimicrobiales bacterium]
MADGRDDERSGGQSDGQEGGSSLALSVIRHSTAHVMAQAVSRLWPGTKLAIGPAIDGGFYYDFDLPGGQRFQEADLERIEAEMRDIIAADQPFEREQHPLEEGLALFADQPYKLEIIQAVGEGEEQGASATGVSIYRNGLEFYDLCRGPHVPSTGRLGHFRLTRLAGAYWRGDESRPQLQRVYGVAFESEASLAGHMKMLEEAAKRDHRKLGAELDLFSFPPELGSGLAVFHPKGGIVRRVMEDYARKRHEEAGYSFVNTPHITKGALFEISGHLQWFGDAMYPPMEMEGARYYLKPMNCPMHILIYRSRGRSYRELPLRLFEFGTVYRYEKSGVVHGLTRVRGMTQDDAHIFCTREQMAGELQSLLEFVLALLADYGLSEFYLELSTRDPAKSVGTDEEWEAATAALAEAAAKMGLELVTDHAGAAFYGPKISVQAKDAIGRTWQVSTIQLDFQMPQLFDLEYQSADGTRQRPVMVHRALFGSVERFFGILVEHYAGALPVWLSPVQATVLPVRDGHEPYARRVAAELQAAGVRAETDPAAEPLGARIRRAKLAKVPYVLVVGDDDVAHGTVGVNARGEARPERDVAVGEMVGRVSREAGGPAGDLRGAGARSG